MKRASLAIAVFAAASFASGSAALSDEKLRAIASFSILGDMAARVGGDRVEVTTIVGPGGDAHVYEPKPRDVKAFAAAQVVFVNGLGFEGWLGRLAEASGTSARIAVVSDGVAALGDDPHAWQDARNAISYAGNIAKALCEADPPGCESYKANAARYVAELEALDKDIAASFASIPRERRIVVTSHDAFGYFANAYGLTFLAPEGVSTESEASARDVAKLIAQIRERKATALFVETISDTRLIEQIARETGLTIGGKLYSDSLSPSDGPAATYIAMMRHNTDLLADAMMER